jgi:hypothetical protein
VLSAHVNDGETGIDLSGTAGDFPAIKPAAQADISY